MSFLTAHLPVLPIVLPLVAAGVLLILQPLSMTATRAVSLISSALLLAMAVYAIAITAPGEILVYRLGDWPAPYGIVMVLDRLSAMMLLLTAIVAFVALWSATRGDDTLGRNFHVLFQLQLMGLAGAFLTGDVFNLFVFFEILLLASYALLAHGGGARRTRATLTYTVLNLAGSAVFLIALGLLYGAVGTLNLADIANLLPNLPAVDAPLARVAITLLFAVFLLKAAMFPMSFWLPRTYPAATASVMVLFVLMTKVGVYAALRVATLTVDTAPATAGLLAPWLTPLAIATIAIGTVGALAATRLSVVVANLILISSGTLLAVVAVNSVAATAAAMYYLAHSTLVAAGLFLVVDAIAKSRGPVEDAIGRGAPIAYPYVVGGAFLVLALGMAGIPPLSGFIGKLMSMQAVYGADLGFGVWAALLVSGLVVALVLARAGSLMFWQPRSVDEEEIAMVEDVARLPPRGAIVLLAVAGPILAMAAAPISDFARGSAEQMHARQPYIGAVLGNAPVERERRP